LIFAALVISLVSLAYGLNYMWFTGSEITRTGDRIRIWPGDTVSGPYRTNDCFFFQDTIFPGNDFVIASCDSPAFHHFVTNAPPLEFPQTVDWIRQQAVIQGHYFNHGDTMQARAHLEGNNLRYWTWPMGMPFDSSQVAVISLGDSAVVFFNTPMLSLWGTISTTLIMGTSGRAGLEDNVVYASSTPPWGELTPNHPEKFALVAEGEIKILDTPANGHGDSNNRGYNQMNPDSTSIALNGFFCALNESFTFEHQNDADSGYVYQYPSGVNHVDDRGVIFLWGALAQKRRGYVHRSTPPNSPTGSSTGYLKQYVYDYQLEFWNLGIFDTPENQIVPSAVNLGNVLVGDTARDTVYVINGFVPITIDSVRAPLPFSAVLPDSYRWQQPLVVGFAPTSVGVFDDTVRFYIAYYHQWLTIPVSGVGIANAADRSILRPSAFSLSCNPNPFNAQTRISFSLPRAEVACLYVFDILGQRVATLQEGLLNAGEHSVSFDGSALPSGVYFVQLKSASLYKTDKLLLLK